MSAEYPYKPPPDAPEWTCPLCRCDLLWCGCKPSVGLHVTESPYLIFGFTGRFAYSGLAYSFDCVAIWGDHTEVAELYWPGEEPR